MLSFDEAVMIASTRSDARLIAIDGPPLAGKSTLATQIAKALQADCVYLDDFVKPATQWRSRTTPSFPFDYVRYDDFLAAVKALAQDGSCSYRPYDWSIVHRRRIPAA
jgi:uridine kinase